MCRGTEACDALVALADQMELDVRNTFHDGEANSFNVVADIPGGDKADEIVMLGARSALEWQDAQAMARAAVPPAFWQSLRQAGLLPDEAPTP